ncbi:MAG: hypothetical protein PHX47_03005 [Candidatus ainarchaeum sp.]|jgi:hypothetical protein|nr:hypothetical protein [Candidatus ainarchaeum sp.]
MVLKKSSNLFVKSNTSSKRKIVHLGNVGEDAAFRSKVLAEKFPGFMFFGIDLKDIKSESYVHESMRFKNFGLKEKRQFKPVPKNLKQYKEDFVNGLSRFKNNSLDLVVSDFALGFYSRAKNFNNLKVLNFIQFFNVFSIVNPGSKKYTQKVVDLISKKLKPGGKVIVYTFREAELISKDKYLENINSAFSNNFKKVNVSLVETKNIPVNYRSFYMQSFNSKRMLVYRVSAQK